MCTFWVGFGFYTLPFFYIFGMWCTLGCSLGREGLAASTLHFISLSFHFIHFPFIMFTNGQCKYMALAICEHCERKMYEMTKTLRKRSRWRRLCIGLWKNVEKMYSSCDILLIFLIFKWINVKLFQRFFFFFALMAPLKPKCPTSEAYKWGGGVGSLIFHTIRVDKRLA